MVLLCDAFLIFLIIGYQNLKNASRCDVRSNRKKTTPDWTPSTRAKANECFLGLF